MPNLFCLSSLRENCALVEVRTMGQWSINCETLDTGWSDGSLELLNQLQWVTAGKKESRCVLQCVLLFLLQTLTQECHKHPVTSHNLSRKCCSYWSISCNSSTRSLRSRDVNTKVVLFVSWTPVSHLVEQPQQCECWLSVDCKLYEV